MKHKINRRTIRVSRKSFGAWQLGAAAVIALACGGVGYYHSGVQTQAAAVLDSPAKPSKTSVTASKKSSPVLAYTEKRLLATDKALKPPKYPVRTKGTSRVTVGADDWTAGFYAATLWQTYERTKDPKWKKLAEKWQSGLEKQKTNPDTADLGFKMFDTYGTGYRLTKNKKYKQVTLDSANTLAKRYNPKVKMFRVWKKNDYRVNIDAMMNMELMFWSGKNGGNKQHTEMATQHAKRTIKDLVREDGGTYMFTEYDPKTGKLKRHFTEQGHATDSTWARGQAWAVYGFTMAYRYTKDPEFLETAKRTADYYIKRLPADQIPPWDFDVPSASSAPRDTSASAVVASGLLELSGFETDAAAKKRYLDTTDKILKSLSSTKYAPENKKFPAMLQHGTQHLPKGWKDSGLMFGDYYYVQALNRYEKAGKSTAKFMAN